MADCLGLLFTGTCGYEDGWLSAGMARALNACWLVLVVREKIALVVAFLIVLVVLLALLLAIVLGLVLPQVGWS